jgi:uncharacterized protein YciI
MTAFLLQSEYTAPLAKVDEVRVTRIERLKEQAGNGRLVIGERRQPPTGRVMVVLAHPYVLRDFAKCEIFAFEPGGIP